MRTQAYRNLNKQGVVYSLRQNGLVVGYASTVVLTDATCKHACESALSRISAGPREVCAWVSGTLSDQQHDTTTMNRLLCDPKKQPFFCDAVTGARVDSASIIVLTTNGAFYQ